jgi:type IV pilus assembly protein PilO
MSKQLRIILSIVIILGIIWGLNEYVFKPQRTALNTMKDKLDIVTFDLKRAKQESENLEKLKKELEKVREQVAFVEKKLPREKEISELLRELSRKAEETPIDFVSITPQPGIREESLERLPLEIEVRSGYYNLTKYLQKLEDLPRLIDIRKIYIKSDENIPPQLSLKLTADIFVLKEGTPRREREGREVIPRGLEIYEKDPFIPLGKERLQKKSKLLTLSLTGVVIRENHFSAIINDELVEEGDFIGEKKVLEIRRDEVVLVEGKERYVLKLEE